MLITGLESGTVDCQANTLPRSHVSEQDSDLCFTGEHSQDLRTEFWRQFHWLRGTIEQKSSLCQPARLQKYWRGWVVPLGASWLGHGSQKWHKLGCLDKVRPNSGYGFFLAISFKIFSWCSSRCFLFFLKSQKLPFWPKNRRTC